MDLSTAATRLEAALNAEHALTTAVIEAGFWGDHKGAIEEQLVSLFLTEDAWSGDAPFTPFSTSLSPPATVAFPAKALRKLALRRAFKAERYAASDVGGVVRVYTGDNTTSEADKPRFAFDLSDVGSGPQVVAAHEVCFKCKATGERDGGPCGFVDYGGATCLDGLMFKGGLSFEAGERLESSKRSDPEPGWEGLMER